MSKTQLQINNTNLASLIETLAGKATGGSGGAIETCTVALRCDAPSMAVAYSVDGTGNYQVTDFPIAMRDDILITVQKNTILFLSDWGSTCSSTGDLLQIYYGGSKSAYWVTGDGVLIYTM